MAEKDDLLKPIKSAKHRRFIKEYLRDFDAVRAYLIVYPNDSDPRMNAWLLLNHPKISKSVKEFISIGAISQNLSKDRCLIQLGDILGGGSSAKVKIEAIKTLALINEWIEEDNDQSRHTMLYPPLDP